MLHGGNVTNEQKQGLGGNNRDDRIKGSTDFCFTKTAGNRKDNLFVGSEYFVMITTSPFTNWPMLRPLPVCPNPLTKQPRLIA